MVGIAKRFAGIGGRKKIGRSLGRPIVA